MNGKYMCAAWHFRTTTQLHSKGMIYCRTGYTRYIPGIYQVYTRYRLWIYNVKDTSWPSELPISAWNLEAWDRDFLWIFSVLAREAAHSRLGPSKVPPPGVDLVNMAAPPRGTASTIGTAALIGGQACANRANHVETWNRPKKWLSLINPRG